MKRNGVVYTPEYWADWAVETYGIAEKWIKGGVVLDPGCGEGSLTTAVIRRAFHIGYSPTPDDLARLNCIDRDVKAIRAFREELQGITGMHFSEVSLHIGDYLLENPGIRADVVFSNPPWISFGDMDNEDKGKYKPVFRSSGLTPNPKSLILGGSRIDLAALFVAVALNRDTAENGEGVFFLPSSLFRSEAAHSAFRQLKLPGGRSFALKEIWDMEGEVPFPGAGTAYCLAYYKADEIQQWPVSWYLSESANTWKKMAAEPAEGPESPLMPRPAGSPRIRPPRIQVPQGTVPRQGVNSQGATAVFQIREIGEVRDGRMPVVSKNGVQGFLPAELVFPLMSVSTFSENREIGDDPIPDKWIFMPYRQNGKVLNREELETFPDALEWIERHRDELESRRGMMLKQAIKKGIYWSMIGVGPYSFAPWKLAWESYGRNRFVPRLFCAENGVHWQGNQALHAFLPFDNKKSAHRAFQDLLSPDLEEYLKKLGGAGTKTWAQPGRIRRLLASEFQ